VDSANMPTFYFQKRLLNNNQTNIFAKSDAYAALDSRTDLPGILNEWKNDLFYFLLHP